LKIITFEYLKKLVENRKDIEIVCPLKEKAYVVIDGIKHIIVDAKKAEILEYFEK
jgi:uncharacterized protein YbaR (Trm112 family)